MTDDLVKRLRDEAEWRDQYAWSRLDGGQDYTLAASLAIEAADCIEQLDRLVVITGKINVQLMECAMEQKGRIEELEADLRDIACVCEKGCGGPHAQCRARAALGEKKDD